MHARLLRCAYLENVQDEFDEASVQVPPLRYVSHRSHTDPVGLASLSTEKAQALKEEQRCTGGRKDPTRVAGLYQREDLQLLQRPDQLQTKVSLVFNLYRGSPMELLKSINPHEAGLLDAASRCHIRFRLGGAKFPPLIYYKIFIHGGIVDINAFAPRNYMALKKQVKKSAICVKFDKPENEKDRIGWYMRHENNGWRPISDKMLVQNDPIETKTSEQKKEFHYSKAVRQE